MRGRQARRLVIGSGPPAATTVDAAAGAYPTSIIHCQDAAADLPSCLRELAQQAARLRCQHQVALLVVQLQRLVDGLRSLLGSVGQA
jgi:hypothetical protein